VLHTSLHAHLQVLESLNESYPTLMDELKTTGPVSRLQAQAAAAAAAPASTAAAAAAAAAAAGGIGVSSTASSSAPSAAPLARSPAPPPALSAEMSADPATLTHTEPPPPEFAVVEPLGREQSATGAEVLPTLEAAPKSSSVDRSPSPKLQVRSRSSISSFFSRPNRASKRGKTDGRGSHEDEHARGKYPPRRSISVGHALSKQAMREQNERDLKAMALDRLSKRGNLGGSGGGGGGGGKELAGFLAALTSPCARKAAHGRARGNSRHTFPGKLGRRKTVFLFSARVRVNSH